MFDLIFDATFSFQSIMFIIAGLAIGLIGGAILGYSIYKRVTSERYMARVIGVNTSSSSSGQNMYRAVYEFTSKSGETHKLPSNSSSSMTKNKETGRAVEIMYSPGGNHVTATGSYLGSIIGIGLLVPGLWLLQNGLSLIEINPVSIFIFLIILVYIGFKISKTIKPKGSRETIAQFQTRMKQKRTEDYGELKQLENIIDSPTFRAQQEQQRKQNKVIGPVFLLCAMGLLYGSYYFGMETAYLTANGNRTNGEIIRFESERSSSNQLNSTSSTIYYPVFTFKTDAGQIITTKSRVGSSHQSNKRGDQVDVLYDPKDPKGLAIVDYGLANWMLPGILGAMGLLFSLISLSAIRNRSS